MIFNWSTWKMDPTPAGDVILWRSREDAEPLQCWALWWRARLPRHRGDRTSVDCVGVLGGAKRWRIFLVEKRKAGLILMDFNGFYTHNQRTIHQCALSRLSPIFIHHCRQLGIPAPTKHEELWGFAPLGWGHPKQGATQFWYKIVYNL